MILIGEDHREILSSIKELLELEGFSVFGAENGAAALDFLQECPNPELILLDMRMPIMDGWEFASKYSQNYQTRSPIVVMTAEGDAQTRAREIGAQGWISKPFHLTELLDKIHSHRKWPNSNASTSAPRS